MAQVVFLSFAIFPKKSGNWKMNLRYSVIALHILYIEDAQWMPYCCLNERECALRLGNAKQLGRGDVRLKGKCAGGGTCSVHFPPTACYRML